MSHFSKKIKGAYLAIELLENLILIDKNIPNCVQKPAK